MGGVAGDAKGGAGKKRKKDPDRPKRATTAYLVFCERHRKTVMRKNPELRSKQVPTELARLWQAVEPRERSICQEVAQKDSQRHEREMEEYRAPAEGLGRRASAAQSGRRRRAPVHSSAFRHSRDRGSCWGAGVLPLPARFFSSFPPGRL